MKNKIYVTFLIIILSVILLGCSGQSSTNDTFKNNTDNTHLPISTPTYTPHIDIPPPSETNWDVICVNKKWNEEYQTNDIAVNNSSFIYVHKFEYNNQNESFYFNTTDGKAHFATINYNFSYDRTTLSVDNVTIT